MCHSQEIISPFPSPFVEVPPAGSRTSRCSSPGTSAAPGLPRRLHAQPLGFFRHGLIRCCCVAERIQSRISSSLFFTFQEPRPTPASYSDSSRLIFFGAGIVSTVYLACSSPPSAGTCTLLPRSFFFPLSPFMFSSCCFSF